MKTLNEVFSSPSTRRRYEVWFVRLGLADGGGAWWFRYLLMNPGRGGCPGDPRGMPLQLWATWFLMDGKPEGFIQGFPLAGLELSARGRDPFHFRIGNNEIQENSCRGALEIRGHSICWDLQFHSTFRVTLSSKGWIGFSRTPHSDALLSGQTTLDGRRFQGDPLGLGCKGITVATGIVSSGVGHTRIFLGLAERQARLKFWFMKCHLGWPFAKQCYGITQNSASFVI